MFHTSHVFSLCLWLVGVFGDEVKSVSVMEGHSVALHTNVTELQRHDEIEWRFGDKIRIARIKRSVDINPTYDDNNETEIFRDRLKMNNQTGDLTITHVTSQHSGLYTFSIYISDEPKVKKRITVTVNAPSAVSISESTQTSSSSSASSSTSSTSSSSSPDNKPGGLSDYIIPLSCAAAAGFLMVVTALLIFCICRKHTNTQHQQDETREEEITYADTSFYRHDTKAKRVKEEDEVVYAGVVTRR